MLRSECKHRFVICGDPCDQFAIADVAFVEGNFRRNGIAMTARQVVEDNNLLTTTRAESPW
jgi:hypothetical protein